MAHQCYITQYEINPHPHPYKWQCNVKGTAAGWQPVDGVMQYVSLCHLSLRAEDSLVTLFYAAV